MNELENKNRIGILGAGTWGMALAKMLAETGKMVEVWSPIEQELNQLSEKHTHPKLPGVFFPVNIKYTKSIEEVCMGKEIILFAVPSVFVRSTAQKINPYISSGQIIVDVAKGIESDTLMTLTEVIGDELFEKDVHLVALSGPTHAEEVAMQLPTTIVSACKDLNIAERVQAFFTSPYMRVYTNTDVRGIEIRSSYKGSITLGDSITIMSGKKYNIIGNDFRTVFRTLNDGKIKIGKNVGISNSTIVSAKEIVIEDNVMIGGNCQIFDTDFHPISYLDRLEHDAEGGKTSSILIKEGAFIGANVMILKGVTIGKYSVIGAGSVVTKSVPDGEIWAGNPAVYIRKVSE